VAIRLNERLHDEVRRLIGTMSADLDRATQLALQNVSWQGSTSTPVTEVARAVLAEAAKNPKLAREAAAASARVRAAPAVPVASILHLDAPVIDNPALHADVTRGLTTEFTRLAGLSDQDAWPVIQHSEALVNSSTATLDALVTRGSLTKQEQALLTEVLDLARLTGDNLALIRALLAQGVTSPLPLVSWTAGQWQQFIDGQRIPVPPGDTSASYARTIVSNLETTYPAHALAAHSGDPHLATLLERNPHLDLRTADLAGGAAAHLDWTGVPAEAGETLHRDLRSYQRLLTLADSAEDQMALKRAGYDSALAIIGQPEEEFVRTSGLDEGRARLTHARAHGAAASVAQHYAGLHDLLKNGFSNLPAGNTAALADELRKVEGMNELFGSQDFCECDDSHSVLSPAAYFVDLMHFLDTNVFQPYFTHPGHADHPLHLKRRRPDLWTLQLSPANTSTLIPYLTIVNEVLENYLYQARPGNIYETLNDPSVKVSFHVPFSLPFAELSLYLGHFGISPADVYRTLGLPAMQVHRARLGLAPADASVITTPDPAGVATRLGHTGEQSHPQLQDFLRITGLERGQFDALLASRFLPDLGAITVISQDELQNTPPVIANLTRARLDHIHRLVRLWRRTSWTITELDLILAAGAQARLIGRDLDDKAIEFLARLTSLQTSLRLPAEELCALIADMPASAASPPHAAPAQQHLYERVFDLPALFATAPAAAASGHLALRVRPDPLTAAFGFHHSAFNTTNPDDDTTDPKTPFLLSALGVSGTDFQTLLGVLAGELAFSATGDCQLDRHRLSLLYRHARLAAALNVSIADLAGALSLLFEAAERALTTLGQVEQLVDFITWQRASAFTIAELRFILAGATDGPVKFTTTAESTALLVKQAQAAHAADPRDTLRVQLATTFSLPPARLADLLAWVPADINGPAIGAALAAVIAPDGNPATASDLIPLTDLVQQLERVILLFANLELDDASLSYLTGHREAVGITVPASLTVADARALALYHTMITGDSAAPAVIQAILGDLTKGSHDAAAHRRVAELWHVSPVLPASLRKVLPTARTPIEQLRSLREAATLCTTLGISAPALADLGRDGSFGALGHARDIAVGAVTAKYTEGARRDQVLPPLRDRVNALKRDALCDYILGWGAGLNFRSRSDLYDFFLIDPDMDGCFQTSRVVAATSTLQLYAERCRQDLEQTRDKYVPQVSIPPSAIHADQWEWRKNFRVWQANRKVFLYPESYLDPGLLDVKTPLLEDLEDDLLQQKITTDSASDAYHSYLTRFAELANLRIAGSCYNPETHPGTYYFFGCTHQDPPVYYWRSWNGAIWSPWRKIDLAINARTVSPAFRRGRLYLFWVDTKSKDKTAFKDGNSHLEYYEVTISLQYSSLQPNGKWLAPQKLDSLRPPQTTPGHWNNRLYPPLFATLAAAGVAIGLNPLRAVQSHFPGLFDPPEADEADTDDAQAGGSDTQDVVTFVLDLTLEHMERTKTYRRVYPVIGHSGSVVLSYFNRYLPGSPITVRELDLFHNKLRNPLPPLPTRTLQLPAVPAVLLFPQENGIYARLGIRSDTYGSEPEFDLALEHLPQSVLERKPGTLPHIAITGSFPYSPSAVDETRIDHVLNLVHNRYPESILTLNGQHYLIHELVPWTHSAVEAARQHPAGGHPPPTAAAHPASHDGAHPEAHHRAAVSPHGRADHAAKAHQAARATSIGHAAQTHAGPVRRQLVRLSTSTADDLGEAFMEGGLDELFALHTQKRTEQPVGIPDMSPTELSPSADNPDHLDFNGAMGAYYREIYFYIPWLIARALRADGKYQDALSWYRRICDFTAHDSGHDLRPTDRPWRYIEFRGRTLPKLKAMLTDKQAIQNYEQDPFNPHAIARLRPSAYQRAIVMEIIGTYHDLGDSLFAKDTMESINEASLYYSRAAEMLGPRPARLGRCHTIADTDLTYEKLGPAIGKPSEMLLFLENWTYANHTAASVPTRLHAPAAHPGTTPPGTARPHIPLRAAAPHTPPAATQPAARPVLAPYRSAAAEHAQSAALAEAVKSGSVPVPHRHAPAVPAVLHSTLAFCIPPSDALLSLYDQVEDRLFKIRNCMNISGVRRQLALFAPPIDVMALVRARAAGLSLDEAMAALEAPVPPYRFSYLIERAREAARTVQSFGAALLPALEKKDAEELTRLRSLHERDVLRMTKKVKTDQAAEARHQLQALTERKTHVQSRIDYHSGLIDAGHIAWEVTEQARGHVASVLRAIEPTLHTAASIAHLIPQVGSPFAMKFGGAELGQSAKDVANNTLAMAASAEKIASLAGLEGSRQRRDQEWHQQLQLARQELKQIEEQRLAAEIRAAIAEKEADIHQAAMDQADELDHFYKDKFTSLSLYNYLATTLTRLHREAYNTAERLARVAQRAYAFERDDDTPFIAAGNWETGKNGLLAGEKLTLQLQQLEAAYLATNTRQLEMSQSFSLAVLDPRALLTFRETGCCDFAIPEILFDLAYPGQYKRIIKSARISIPSTSPNTTLSAKLTLISSQVRKRPTDPAALVDGPAPPTSSIATSTAVNDGGAFELTFRDERYLPFEGAGAINSKWRLQLPSQLRMFDYATISDIILHISYTARDDDDFRKTVETNIVDTLTHYASHDGMYRLFSLRHDFPDAFHQLLTVAGTAQQTHVKLGREHFPYFLSTRALHITGASLSIQPEGANPVDTTGLTISVNDHPNAAWTTPEKTRLRSADIPAGGPALADWTIKITTGHLDPAAVSDVLLLFKYRVS
jgi:hypothetical protein